VVGGGASYAVRCDAYGEIVPRLGVLKGKNPKPAASLNELRDRVAKYAGYQRQEFTATMRMLIDAAGSR